MSTSALELLKRVDVFIEEFPKPGAPYESPDSVCFCRSGPWGVVQTLGPGLGGWSQSEPNLD